MATSQGHFKWTDDKTINLMKFLQELESSYVKISFLKNENYKFQLFVVAIVFFFSFWHTSGLVILLSSNFLFT